MFKIERPSYVIKITPKKPTHYIYKFTNKANNKCYIGQTKNPEVRIQQHLTGEGSKSLLTDLVEYGIKQFKIEIIDSTATQDFIDDLEDLYITKYDSIANGYNMTMNRHPKVITIDPNDMSISAKCVGDGFYTIGLNSQYLSYQKLISLPENVPMMKRTYNGFQYIKIRISGTPPEPHTHGKTYEFNVRLRKINLYFK